MNDDTFLDARVRRGLQALPLPDDARTIAALDTVLAERPGRSRAALTWAAAAAAVVGLGVPLLLRSQLAGDEPEPAPQPDVGLSGSWTRQVTSAQETGWSGRWTVGFDDSGVLVLGAPAGARDVSDGAAYAVDGSRVRMDAFVNSVCDSLPPGVYAWSHAEGGLRLIALDDPCEPRTEVFEGTWAEGP